MSGSVEKSTAYASQHLEETTDTDRKRLGQFFTPPSIAEFMAELLKPARTPRIRLLDPGAGAGILGIAAARHLSKAGMSVCLTAFEIDQRVTPKLSDSLDAARSELNGRLTVNLIKDDFLSHTSASLFADSTERYDAIISNPPYLKASPSDATDGVDPNIYARFMRRSGELLEPGGSMVFIVPRSFMSGLYFRRFRAFLRSHFTLERVHVFDSRRAAFRDQSVLQENVIVVYRKGAVAKPEVEVSTSAGTGDLATSSVLRIPTRVLYQDDRLDAPIRIPTTPAELGLLLRFAQFPNRLATLGMEISTGPVVPFRARAHLVSSAESRVPQTVPLLWLQHVSASGVTWPLSGFRKAQRLAADAPAKLRAPNKTCVLIRRFSAKEDKRRLIAGAYFERTLEAPWLGLENHLNFIYRLDGTMSLEEAQGLTFLLNSKQYDDYFRVCNGNTQVGATDIRELPLPSLSAIASFGRGTESVTRLGFDVFDSAFT